MKKIITPLVIVCVFVLGLFLLKGTLFKSSNQVTGMAVEDTVETGAQFGDLVTINFVLKDVDGKIIDTNDVEKAQAADLVTYTAGPYQFILGESGKVRGFDEAVVGLEVGESKTRFIMPSEQLTTFRINKTSFINRRKYIPRMQGFPFGPFKHYFQREPVVNDIIYSRAFPWPYKVLNITSKGVITEIFARVGDEFVLPGTEWRSEIVDIGEIGVVFFQKPKDGQVIKTQFGNSSVIISRSQLAIVHNPVLGAIVNGSIPLDPRGITTTSGNFVIKEINDNNFLLERIDNPAEKLLILDVELLELQEDVKEVKDSNVKVSEIP